MPPRNVVPKPVQKPHPPLWVACSRRDTILLAAEKGIGALTLRVHRPRGGRALGGATTSARSPSECVPVGLRVNPQVACVTPMMVHHDEREAIARGLEGANFFGYSLAHYYVFGEHVPGETDVWQEFQRAARADGLLARGRASRVQQETLGAKIAAGDDEGLRGAVGTPDQLREFLRRYEEAGVDQIIFVMQAGRNRHEHIMESLELFGTRGAARVQGARRAAARREGRAARAGDRGRDGAPGRARRADARRLRDGGAAEAAHQGGRRRRAARDHRGQHVGGRSPHLGGLAAREV